MNIPHLKSFVVFSLIGTISLIPLLVLPAMVGVLVDNAGMSDSSAGYSASANFLAAAIIGMWMALRIHRLNLRSFAMAALALATVADIASALTAGDNVAFFAARVFAGFGLGASYVAAVSSFSRFDGFERGFGLYVTLQFIVSGLGLYVVPVYADALGATGLFTSFALLDALGLMLARHLPADQADDANDAESGSELKILLTATAALGILGFMVFEAANNAQFTYIERFGVDLGISDHDVGFSLLIASLIGIPGAFAIVMMGNRFGTVKPLIGGMLIAVGGLFVLINAETYPVYFFGSCCMGFSWAFCLPFIQTTLANIDRKGSAIAAGTSLSTFGSAFGPGLAAMVVGGAAYENVFLLSIGLFVVTIAAFVGVGRSARDPA